MWTPDQIGAARAALGELRIRASTAFVQARTEEQSGAINQVLAWVGRMETQVLLEVMAPSYTGVFTYQRFLDAVTQQHELVSFVDGQIREYSLLATARRFASEVVGQTAVDVGTVAKEVAAGVGSGLPWLALGLGALALIYIASAA